MLKSYILQIDTATEICSVSVSCNGLVIDQIEAQEPNLHASKLTIFIDELLSKIGIGYSDLAAVCVSKGPGSYTGLRIGVSTAKGLCYALDIPLLAINTLDMMYYGVDKSKGTVSTVYVPMLDARRMEVYLEIFDAEGTLLRETEAVIVDEDTFNTYSDNHLVLFGSGASKLQGLFGEKGSITIDNDFKHSSIYMSSLAHQKLSNNEVEDLIYFEPFYLKEFIATVSKKLI